MNTSTIAPHNLHYRVSSAMSADVLDTCHLAHPKHPVYSYLQSTKEKRKEKSRKKKEEIRKTPSAIDLLITQFISNYVFIVN